jgi:pimeloyl-ACP methyl ester carboxylesterase
MATVTANDRAPAVEEVVLHGHRVSFRRAGEGPAIVLIHGIAGNAQTWDEVIPPLAREHTVIAPDMLGHGESAKPRGDYSLGAFASGIRDLMIALEIERATIVGHSLGGGIAMQFAYQFPERVERLVLVSSGGLGAEVSPLLRSATLPAAEYVLPLLVAEPIRDAVGAVARVLGRIGLRPSHDLEEIATGFARLGDIEARQAFIHTVRGVIDIGGQVVSARDRLYLAEEVPTLLIWGERDRIIPPAHGRAAHEAMPGSRFLLYEGAGHFPYRNEPWRFAEDLLEFIEETEPAEVDYGAVRELMARESTGRVGAR